MPKLPRLIAISVIAFQLACSSGQGTGAPGAGGAAGAPATGGHTAAGGSSAGGAGAGGASGSGGNAGAGGVAGAPSTGGHGGAAGEPAAAKCPFGTTQVALWSGTAPGSEGATFTEVTEERSTDPSIHDRAISHVSKPTILPFLAPHPNGAAAIITPGGAYVHLAYDLEGTEIAAWLNSIGVSAFVVKYRLPSDFPGSPWIPLADAQRALRTVRGNAAACGIDPQRVGVIGFSAGGHLASQLETRPGAATTPIKDDVDKLDARPTFGVLMYPVISMDASIAHSGSRNALLGSNPTQAEITLYSSEKQVTSATPQTFIGVSKQDTAVNPQNSVRFDDALDAAGVPQELHMYDDGAHGTGIRKATGDMAAWPDQCAAWLTKMKLTTAN
ncbi:MAG: alpha/beta hydrolase [Pseudomonadota bacterium]